MVYVVLDIFQGIVNDVRVYVRRKDAMAEIRWLIKHTGEPDKEASNPERGYWCIGDSKYEFHLFESSLHRGPATGP